MWVYVCVSSRVGTDAFVVEYVNFEGEALLVVCVPSRRIVINVLSDGNAIEDANSL